MKKKKKKNADNRIENLFISTGYNHDRDFNKCQLRVESFFFLLTPL